MVFPLGQWKVEADEIPQFKGFRWGEEKERCCKVQGCYVKGFLAVYANRPVGIPSVQWFSKGVGDEEDPPSGACQGWGQYLNSLGTFPNYTLKEHTQRHQYFQNLGGLLLTCARPSVGCGRKDG